jgi:hypothetical protein
MSRANACTARMRPLTGNHRIAAGWPPPASLPSVQVTTRLCTGCPCGLSSTPAYCPRRHSTGGHRERC